MVAGICYGTQVFVLQLIVYKQINVLEVVMFLPAFVGFFTTSILSTLKQAYTSWRQTGKLWNLKDSAYLIGPSESFPIIMSDEGELSKNDRVRLNVFNIVAVLTKSLVAFCTQLMKILVMYTAALAGLNYSLVVNMYSLTPFLTAIAFYILFKEKLNSMHLIGIGLLFVCIIITS